MSVSRWAAPFVQDDYEEPQKTGFDRFQAEVARTRHDADRRMRDSGRRALRWAIYAAISFLIAIHAHAWWAVAFWGSTMLWGTAAIFQLEAYNVARIVSTIQPDD